jgi:starch phosphorylase
MKSSIGTLSYSFNTQRMVKDYTDDSYSAAHERCQNLIADGAVRARALAVWLSRLQRGWANLSVEAIEALHGSDLPVGSNIHVRTRVRLGHITPDEVSVELYLGRLNADGEIIDAVATPMQPFSRGLTAGVPVVPETRM